MYYSYNEILSDYNYLVKKHNLIVEDNKFLRASYRLLSANLTWINEGKYVKGYAVNNYFYCVVTDGLSNDEIIEIDVHEKTHILVYNAYEHYCKGEPE
jgi:hypothetical protein